MEHSVEDRGSARVVHLEGPVDVSGALELRDLLGAQIDGAAARVVIDLAGVTLVDSSGIGVFVTAHRRAEELGAGMAIGGAPGPVGRVFELTRTNKLLRIHDTVEEAIADVSGG